MNDTTQDTLTDRLVSTATIAIMEADEIDDGPGSWIRPTVTAIQEHLVAELVVIEELAGRLERERQAAQAIEHANSAANTAAAYQQGRENERRRVLALLEAQREALGRGGVNAISLATLKRALEVGEG